MSRERRKKIFVADPQLANLEAIEELIDELRKKTAQEIKAEYIKGDRGEPGHTPTDEELLILIRPLIPQLKQPKDGHTPTIDELLTLIRPLIPRVKDGETPSDERLIRLIKPLIPKLEKIEIPEIEPDEIASKLNTLKKAIKSEVIDGLLTVQDVINELKDPKSKNKLELKHIKGAKLDMSDMRWHGAGLSKVSVDGISITGDGTPSNPLSAPGSTTDEKVKYDVNDPTAGYVVDKFVAGAGISLAEGTGANENKLQITNTGVITEVDPVFSAWLIATPPLYNLNGAVLVDQTSQQTVLNNPLIFDKGLWSNDNVLIGTNTNTLDYRLNVVGKAPNTTTVVDPTNFIGSVIVPTGSFNSQRVDLTLWSYKVAPDSTKVYSETPATTYAEDTSGDNFSISTQWDTDSADGYVIQAYDVSGMTYYYIDVGPVLNYYFSDFTGWTVSGFTPAQTTPYTINYPTASITNSADTGLKMLSTGELKTNFYTTNGFIKTTGSDGSWTIDTSTYLTAEADTLNTVLGRGATSAVVPTLSNGIKTPKIYPTADSTTAFGFFKANGTTNIFNVDSTNSRIGIGTTAPSGKLHVKQDDTDSLLVTLESALSTQARLSFVETGGVSYTMGLRGSTNNFVISTNQDLSVTPRLIMDSNGNVGINGTPLTKFHIKGSDTNTTPEALLNISRAYNAGVGFSSAATFLLSNPSSGLNNSRLDLKLLYGNQNVDFVGDTDVMSWGSNGNVGIGTVSPAVMLEIRKDIDSGTYTQYPSFTLKNANTTGVSNTVNSYIAGTVSGGGVAGLIMQVGASAVNNAAQNGFIRTYETFPLILGNNSDQVVMIKSGKGGTGFTTASGYSPNFPWTCYGANLAGPTLGSAVGTWGIASGAGPLYGMAMGVAGTGRTWMQSQRFDTNTAVYGIDINPSGGTVLVGDKLIFTQTDGNEYIDSLADGFMDYGATTAHRFLANVKLTADNRSLIFGTGDDMSIYYDGTKGNIDTSLIAASDLNVSCGTDKTLVLTESVWDDMQFPLASGKVPATNFPTWETFTTNTEAYAFSVDDKIQLQADEPSHGWKEGTVGYAHIHITQKTAQTSGANRFAKFELIFAYADYNGVWTEQSAMTQELTIPTGSSALQQYLLSFSTTVTLTGLHLGSQVKCRVRRIAATGGTEYADDVYITQVGVHIEKVRIGSRTVSGA